MKTMQWFEWGLARIWFGPSGFGLKYPDQDDAKLAILNLINSPELAPTEDALSFAA